MGYIKEPAGVDFVVAPGKHTADDTKAIRQAIAAYKNAAKSSVDAGAISPGYSSVKPSHHIDSKKQLLGHRLITEGFNSYTFPSGAPQALGVMGGFIDGYSLSIYRARSLRRPCWDDTNILISTLGYFEALLYDKPPRLEKS